MTISNIPSHRYIPAVAHGAGAPARVEDERLMAACRDFEAIFVEQMLKSMRKTIDRTGLNGGGFAAELYEDMLYGEYAAKMAESARFGISDMLYRQLTHR